MRTVLRGWVLLLIPFSVSIEAAQSLDLQALDQVTAAGVNPQHNWIQREGETIVASGSIAEVELLSNTILQGDVQSDASALTVANVAATDNAQLLNVAIINDEIIFAEQTNYLEQDARFVGRLGRTLSGGPTVFYSYGRGYNRITDEGFSEGVVQIDRSFTSILESETLGVSVPKWDPTKDFTFQLGSWDTGSFSVGTLGIDLILDTGIAGSYGLAASTGPVVLYGPALDLGSIRLYNDDVIFQPGSFTLPAVDFGNATFEFCVAACTSGSIHLGRVGGTKIDPFSDVTLAGANPFKDWDLNAGSGIAAIGQGEVTVTGPGAYIDLGLTLDMNAALGSITDFLDDTIFSGPLSDLFDDVFGVKPSDILPSSAKILPVISFEERIVLLDPGPARTYQIDEDGLCVTFGAPGCEIERVITFTTVDEQDNTLTETTDRFSNSQMEYWEFEETIILVPGNFEGAQADMIVTTDSQLTHTKNNNTLLTDGAQRNLTAMNAINAANAVIGNSSNLMTSRVQLNQQQIHRQSNQFVQFR
jgi:hypothetical protein